jgi:hypothetical protein
METVVLACSAKALDSKEIIITDSRHLRHDGFAAVRRGDMCSFSLRCKAAKLLYPSLARD